MPPSGAIMCAMIAGDTVNSVFYATSTFWVSLLGGGLAGGIVNVGVSRYFYLRGLRTRFYPKLNDLVSEYVVRIAMLGKSISLEKVFMPDPVNKEFIEHRATFILTLTDFNELKEVRDLRKIILKNQTPERTKNTEDDIIVDLGLELDALNECLSLVHKKIGFD